MNIYQIATKTELKRWLNISGASHDDFLDEMGDAATTLIETYIGNVVVTRRFVEDIDITKPQQSDVMTTWYPIYLSPLGGNFTLYHDTDREFKSTSIVSESDYIIDTAIGKIKLVDGYFLRGRGVVRVDYWAGLSRFEIVAGVNDTVHFTESGTPKTATLTAGKYSAEDIATHIAAQMTNAGTNTYSAKYDHFTQKFTISSSAAFDLNWSKSPALAKLLGFNAADGTGQTSYTSDVETNGVPGDIRNAAKMIVARWWKLSKFGEGTQEIVREIMEQAGTREYSQTALPLGVAETLDKYKRAML